MTLDFTLKKIIIEDEVALNELYEHIQKVLPDWKEWKLESKVIYRESQHPLYIPYQPYTTPPNANPFWPQVWYGTGTQV